MFPWRNIRAWLLGSWLWTCVQLSRLLCSFVFGLHFCLSRCCEPSRTTVLRGLWLLASLPFLFSSLSLAFSLDLLSEHLLLSDAAGHPFTCSPLGISFSTLFSFLASSSVFLFSRGNEFFCVTIPKQFLLLFFLSGWQTDLRMIRGDLGASRWLLEQHRMDKLLMGADSEPHKLCKSGAGRQWCLCLHQRNLFLGTVFWFRHKATGASLEPGEKITDKRSLSEMPFMVFICCVCRTLLQQLQKLQTLVMGKVSRTCKLAGTQTGTCLMVSFPNEEHRHQPGLLARLQPLPSLPCPSAGGWRNHSSLRGCFSPMMWQRMTWVRSAGLTEESRLSRPPRSCRSAGLLCASWNWQLPRSLLTLQVVVLCFAVAFGSFFQGYGPYPSATKMALPSQHSLQEPYTSSVGKTALSSWGGVLFLFSFISQSLTFWKKSYVKV